MEAFTGLELQKRSGDVQRSALVAPVAITNHGNPRLVLLSVEEFGRLSRAAGEALPPELFRRHPVVQHGIPDDPLGRDTSDFDTFVNEVVEHALSGRDRQSIVDEMHAAERSLGFEPGNYRV